MAEYLIKDRSLTGIADAIRAKTGGTEAITIDQMISEIASLSASASITASGEIFPTEDITSTITIEHGLGTMPGVCIAYAENPYTDGQSIVGGVEIVRPDGCIIPNNIHYGWFTNSYGNVSSDNGRNYYFAYVNENTFNFQCNDRYPLRAGVKIKWKIMDYNPLEELS